MSSTYDFSGWATRNDIECADGLTIRQDAFADCDGIDVPLVYMHDHKDPENVLGHAMLENREDGVYCYGSFNETEKGEMQFNFCQNLNGYDSTAVLHNNETNETGQPEPDCPG